MFYRNVGSTSLQFSVSLFALIGGNAVVPSFYLYCRALLLPQLPILAFRQQTAKPQVPAWDMFPLFPLLLLTPDYVTYFANYCKNLSGSGLLFQCICLDVISKFVPRAGSKVFGFDSFNEDMMSRDCLRNNEGAPLQSVDTYHNSQLI